MIIGASVVYNNKEIFKRTLATFNGLCDEIAVIDDGSNECSSQERNRDIENIFNKPFYFSKIEKTENEFMRRSILWQVLCGTFKENDWIVLLDSDESYFSKDWKYLLDLMHKNKNDDNINWISSRLYNMWSEKEYRIDGYWNPKFELKRRIFKLHKGNYLPLNYTPTTIECGEVPEYVFRTRGINTECHLLHWGYISESERKRKYDFHKKVDPDGKFHLSSHINSIIEKPELVELK